MRTPRLLVSAVGALALAGCAGVMTPEWTGPQSQAGPSLHPELVVVNAKVVTADERFSINQALAARDGKFIAVGTNEQIRGLAGPGTRIVDAGGRTVLPGLIDAHIHMFRAGFWWKHEVRVDEAQTLPEILDAIRARAEKTPPGTWILTLGGWHFSQIKERRMPTREELDAVAPNHPVYIQALRDRGQMNSAAIRASGITAATKTPVGVILGKDESGNFNGLIGGFAGARFAESAFPKLTFEDKVEGLRFVMRDFNAAGLTSVGEGTGLGISDDDYQVMFELWRRRQMTVRMAVHVFTNGYEHAQGWIRHIGSGFGDDWLRLNGLGEIVMMPMWDGFFPVQFAITPQAREEFRKIIEAGVRNRMLFQFHATIESTMNHMLDVLEAVHEKQPLDKLRINFLHAEQITPRIIERMKRLGMGVQMQDRQALGSDVMMKNWGARAKDVPPVKSVYRSGLPLAGGTDGTVSASYRPFISIWWLISGKNWRGDVVRPTEKLTREEALRTYTRDAAWFSFEENRKGAIIPGFLADFIVLERDYLTVPEDDIRFLKPVMTVVGGKVVYEAK